MSLYLPKWPYNKSLVNVLLCTNSRKTRRLLVRLIHVERNRFAVAFQRVEIREFVL